MKTIWRLIYLFILAGCTGSSYPENLKPVTGFQADRYLGTWYEVARLDHSFERGLSHVTATYSKRDDGGIKVLNQGFNSKQQSWDEAEGKAYFVQDEKTAQLKVSFFGPFYGAYVVFELDDDYQHAFVAGNNYDYLWLLSRTPQISEGVKQRFLQVVGEKGFNPQNLIWVQHQSDK